MVQKLCRIKIVLKLGKIVGKCDILTVQEKKQELGGNKTNIRLEITPWQREIEARRLKTAKIRTRKLIKKEE